MPESRNPSLSNGRRLSEWEEVCGTLTDVEERGSYVRLSIESETIECDRADVSKEMQARLNQQIGSAVSILRTSGTEQSVVVSFED